LRARVRAAFCAAAVRSPEVRLFAAVRAWRDSAFGDAAAWPSCFNAVRVARERVGDGFSPACFSALFALRRVSSDASPFAGAGSFTPARRAFDNPMAIACFVERAPCFPSRM
jgi:hypothetical protein